MDQCFLKETRSGPNIGRTSKDRMLKGCRKDLCPPKKTMFTYQPSSAKYLIVRTIWLV